MATTPVYLEVADKRSFAVSLDWPGWARAGKTPDEALETLLEAASRFRKTIGVAGKAFTVPKTVKGLRVVEQVRGNATTEFGAPGVPAKKSDAKDPTEHELEPLLKTLQACWQAFDHAAEKAVRKELRKGPRGGGRELDAIVEHVLDADRAYMSKLGAAFTPEPKSSTEERFAGARAAFVEAATLRARGEQPPKPPPRSPMWPVAYAVRRSAWHHIDHVWEIEDRSS